MVTDAINMRLFGTAYMIIETKLAKSMPKCILEILSAKSEHIGLVDKFFRFEKYFANKPRGQRNFFS